jgi:hypothetical protein
MLAGTTYQSQAYLARALSSSQESYVCDTHNIHRKEQSMENGWKTSVFAVFIAILCTLLIFSFAMFFKYRDSPLIANRSPTSVLFQVVSQVIGGIVAYLKVIFGNDMNCGVTLFLVNYTAVVSS